MVEEFLTSQEKGSNMVEEFLTSQEKGSNIVGELRAKALLQP